jgi:hypothetical protein
MKTTRRLTSILFVVLAASALRGQTQDPRHLKVEYEDERLRVMRLTLAPGESTPMLDLGERINVGVTDARLKITFTGSEPLVVDAHAGSTKHEMASRVAFENVGTTEWQCVITEF